MGSGSDTVGGSSLAGTGAGGVTSSFTSGWLTLGLGAGFGNSGSGPTFRLSFGLFGWLLLGLCTGAESAAPKMLLEDPPGGMGLCG